MLLCGMRQIVSPLHSVLELFFASENGYSLPVSRKHTYRRDELNSLFTGFFMITDARQLTVVGVSVVI